ncbi:MAG: sigma 54-interacting transcriptional regulator [Desulfocapsaceae bacterium]|jgi:PAS domain S-box-containing protein|nr:sigma 54-interacting transcriptional regulator [Desulfocapsaceae bacterium]
MSVPNKRLREPDNGYITIDRSGIVNSCNNRAARTIGLPREELLGHHLPTLLEADKRFTPLAERLNKPVESIKNEQFFLSGSRLQSLDSLTVRIVMLPDAENRILGIYIGLIDRSEVVTPRALALDSIVEGVFTVDGDMKITSFNAAAEKMTGWKQEEVLGRPCKTIFQSNICLSSCAVSSCIMNNTTISHDRDVYIYGKDGTPFPVSISAAPLIDSENRVIGGVETFRDISETVKSDIIINAVADGVVTFSDKGIITSFNAGAERITGWLEGDVVGRSCDELFFAADGISACPITAANRSEPCNIIDQEGFVTDKDGFNIPILVSITPMLDDKKRPIGCVQTFRDNTSALQNKLILDSIADGVFTVDRNWRITSFNMAAEVITGWEREDAIGSFCSDVFHSSICGKNCAIAESLYSGRPVSNRSIMIEDIDGKSKPISISASPLVDIVGNVVGGVETFRDLTAMESLRKQLMQRYTFAEIISKSNNMQRIFQILPDIAVSDSTVLILGESGTGKGIMADAIVSASARKDRPFISVNCGAIPETLLESELFGYRSGAFTDARKDRDGRFAAAEGGTIFLDEIGDIPHSLQVKLLRVLEERVYEPLGSNESIKVDVRVIAATNRDLKQLVDDGLFRDDLYYRLKVVDITLPPLRDRKEDIPLLIDHFVDNFRAEKQKDIVGVSDGVLKKLMLHSFPGNIRELENIIEYGFILCTGGFIQEKHLPESFLPDSQQAPGGGIDMETGLTLEQIEQQAIHHCLERNKWKKMITCKELGISKDTLRRKIERYNLENPLEPQ